MWILDIFNFKDKFQQVFCEDNFLLLKGIIKEEIINQIKNNIPGQEKMDIVVQKAVDFINKHLQSSNSLVQWIIDNILIKGVRLLSQSIYDDLKEFVQGL